jgi:hypothetical protein
MQLDEIQGVVRVRTGTGSEIGALLTAPWVL